MPPIPIISKAPLSTSEQEESHPLFSTPLSSLRLSVISNSLSSLDPEWVARTCWWRIISSFDFIQEHSESSQANDVSPPVIRSLIKTGLLATEAVLAELSRQFGKRFEELEREELKNLLDSVSQDDSQGGKEDTFGSKLKRAVVLRRKFLDWWDRYRAWCELESRDWETDDVDNDVEEVIQTSEEKSKEETSEDIVIEEDDPWATNQDVPIEEDDPWNESEEQTELSPSKPSVTNLPPSSLQNPSTASTPPTIPLIPFLLSPLIPLALHMAKSSALSKLMLLCTLQPNLFPYRWTLIYSIPEEAEVGDYKYLLPKIHEDRKTESEWVEGLGRFDSKRKSWKAERESKAEEWVEGKEVDVWISELGLTEIVEVEAEVEEVPALEKEELLERYYRFLQFLLSRHSPASPTSTSILNCFSILTLISAFGLTSPALDSMGETLTLLEKMVTAPLPDNYTWTLESFDSLDTEIIVDSYLSATSPETVGKDTRDKVLPFLHVRRSRWERDGRTEEDLKTLEPDRVVASWAQRLLFGSLKTPGGLSSTPQPLLDKLRIFVSLMESSKPSLPLQMRVLQDDKIMRDTIIKGVYGISVGNLIGGEDEATMVATEMEAMVACLPRLKEWKLDDGADEREVVREFAKLIKEGKLLESTLPQGASPVLDLMEYQISASLQLTTSSLLPTLPLSLISAWGDREAQIRFIKKMIANLMEKEKDPIIWESFIGSVSDVFGKEGEESGLKGGEVPIEGIGRLVIKTVLENNDFKLTNALLSNGRILGPEEAENLVLEVSQEFYDNDEQGNANKGMMKFAVECLSVLPNQSSARISKQKDFIEATSRFFSFLPTSNRTISPIQIRLAKDKLTLLSVLLSSSEDSYRHPDLLLELVKKLGAFEGDLDERILVEVRTRGMCVESAVSNEDWLRAEDGCEKVIELVESLGKRKRNAGDLSNQKLKEAEEVAFKTCYSFSKRSDFRDFEKKKLLLSKTMLFCPAERIAEVLELLRRVEIEEEESQGSTNSFYMEKQPSLAGSIASLGSRTDSPAGSTIFNSAAIHPSVTDTAARAAKSIKAAASLFRHHNLSGSVDVSSQSSSRSDSPLPSNSPLTGTSGEKERSVSGGSRFIGGISNRFERGMGWLIGADQEEQN